MPPPARLSLVSGARLPASHALARPPSITVNNRPLPSTAPNRFRVQGWDPILIFSQIVALQALHYLTLSFILPPLLSILASPTLIAYEGGISSITMILDWREFSGSPTASIAAAHGLPAGLVGLQAVNATSQMISTTTTSADFADGLIRVLERDKVRGWAVAIGWAASSMVDIFYLYHIIRRPTHILDFSLTLLFNHLILTTYYSGSFPTSFFFWLVAALSTISQIVLAEQWCVRREMRDGFTVDGNPGGPQAAGASRPEDAMEMGIAKSGGGGSGRAVEYERVPTSEGR